MKKFVLGVFALGISPIEMFEFVGGDGYANSITIFCKNGVSKKFIIK